MAKRTLHYFMFHGYPQANERKAIEKTGSPLTYTRLLHSVDEARALAKQLACKHGLYFHVYRDTKKLFVEKPGKSNPSSLLPLSWKKAQVRRLPDGRVQVKIANPIRSGKYLPGVVRRGIRSMARRLSPGKTQATLLRLASKKRNARRRRR